MEEILVMKSSSLSLFAASWIASLAFMGASWAQTGGSHPPPAQPSGPPQAQQNPAQPELMKTFDGWQVRCYPTSMAAPCDMWEAITYKNSDQLAVSVSIAYSPSRNVHLIQLIVPLRVDLSKGAVLAFDTFTANPWRFDHCDRIGCYVSAVVDDKLIDALAHGTIGKVTVVPYGAKQMDLQFPLTGFAEAHSAMIDLAHQKASGAPPAPTTPTDGRH